MRFVASGMKFGSGFVIGAGAMLLAPLVLAMVGGAVKPIARMAFKGVLGAYEGAKATLSETKEFVEDTVAEAKAEMKPEKKPKAKTTGKKKTARAN